MGARTGSRQRSKIDLEQLITFLEVVRFNSFSQAARNRRRSQPAVSAQIRVLEEELNTRLFDRSGNSVALTPTGMLFARYAEEIVALHLDAQNAIAMLG